MPSFLFDHIAISVKDVDQSVTFYQKVFDLSEIENTASDSKTRWLSLGEGKHLHLIPRPNEEVKVNKAVHFALKTNDLPTVISKLKQLSIDYSDWIGSPNKDYVRKDGIQQIYFQDPNGYWIEVNNAE